MTALVAALALIYFARKKVQTDESQNKEVIGTKRVVVRKKPSFSSAWKTDLPRPTNLWQHTPYGWSGASAFSYLNARP